ncbi:hypothetical protein F2Q69_00001996 [Brassica cretica]|uniref:Uncharacterized protein n=1 Tax=Brassica cretica TaxID=69181 RepID=A0A8S9PII0_BRACR|nr:hypothetical protein F2Q69_00001996 [Brassica cretica]
MLVPSEIEVKHILLSAGVEESIPLMSDLLQGMTLSALPWGEHGIISRSYVSDFAKLECSSCSAHVAQILQVVKAHVVKLQRPLHTWLAVFGICFMGNSESSHDSGSIYANRFWPDLSMFICGSKAARNLLPPPPSQRRDSFHQHPSLCNDSDSDEGRGFGWCCDVTYYCD